MKRIVLILSATVLPLIGETYLGIRIWIKSDIDKICFDAQNQFGGNKIEALISVLKSDDTSLDTKNKAIWALGKLNDKRPLGILKKLRSGEECDHTRWVCQREIEKAINSLED